MFLIALFQAIIGMFLILLIIPIPVLKSLFYLFLIWLVTALLVAGFKAQKGKYRTTGGA